MNTVVRRLAAAPLLLAVAASSGCVFVPREDAVEAPAAAAASVAPSRDAPRLEPLETRHVAVAPGQDVVGAMQVLFTRYEDTFTRIARPYNVGYDELRAANPGVDVWLPGEQTPVYLPTASVLPDAPREGIVINASMTASGNDQEVTVAFKGEGGVKKLLLSFAPLEKLD